MIHVQNLTRTYGPLRAVDDVSFTIGPGEIVGLLGHNGAGKTTIMKMLTGFLEPTAGTINVDQLEMTIDRRTIQALIGYLPENCPVYPEMTVTGYLEYLATLHGVTTDNLGPLLRATLERTALMDKAGWPAIPFDGQLLVSHQDALLMGGKVQAPHGYADHVVFEHPELCVKCGARICIEACSGQAIFPGENGVPNFDREKCVHCGACLWNCSQADPKNPEHMNIAFRPGTGGLHSAEN